MSCSSTTSCRRLDLTVLEQKRSCPIYFGDDYLASFSKDVSSSKKIALVDKAVANSHLEYIKSSLLIKDEHIFICRAEEDHKNLQLLEDIWEFMLACQLDRKSVVFNIGGGVLGDLGGFAASTFMRGVPFVQVPSTLLSQVDASIGGKLGINFHGIKNLLGTITQPLTVIIAPKFLESLPKREILSGYVEVIKHGLIKDSEFAYKTLRTSPLELNNEQLLEIIIHSCKIKKEIIESDPFEKGLRKILNFGHTIGHAIESLSHKLNTPLLHGEAVSVGIVAENYISKELNLLSLDEFNFIESSLKNLSLPTRFNTSCDTNSLYELLILDKKNVAGEIKWSLLNKIGNCSYDLVANKELVYEGLEYIKLL